jgi:hypothetical protein
MGRPRALQLQGLLVLSIRASGACTEVFAADENRGWGNIPLHVWRV